jgi:hypothetical protein
MVAQMLKRAGKCTWHPEHVVRATADDGAAGVASAAGLKVVVVVVVQLLVSPRD